MTPVLSLADAQARLLDLADPLGPETVSVSDALGRYLASDVTAVRTQPAADLSAMDGYAVASPRQGPWSLVGESAAGRPYSGQVADGQAVRISTGALVPDGADAILLQEDAKVEGSILGVITGQGASDRHIRRKGFDFAIGDVVLNEGNRISPAQLALAVSAGSTSLDVGRLPRVAVMDNGDELATDVAVLNDHRIPASNGAMIEAMLAGMTSDTLRIGPVPDRLDALAEALSATGDVDVIITTGGASVGDHDLVKPALLAWGASIDFWRVAMRPGKPLLIARKGKTFVVGLPGNPVSSFVTAYLFVLPLMRRLAGSSNPLPAKWPLLVGTPLPAGGTRVEFVRAVVSGNVATPVLQQDSSGLRALATANALIERPINAPAARAGDVVGVYYLQNGGTA